MNNRATLSKKMKFIFLSAEKFPPFRVDVTVLFGREFLKRGHTIHWLMQADTPCRRAYHTIWRGCRVWVGATDLGTGLLNRLRKRILDLINDLRIVGRLRRERYDFVLVRDKFLVSVLAAVAAKWYRAQFMYWLSYPFPESNIHESKTRTARYPFLYYIKGQFAKYLLYKFILPSARHIFVQSLQMKNDVSQYGIPREKMTAVPMGVDIKSIPHHLNNGRINTDDLKKMVLYVGTLKRIRRLDFLIRVMDKVSRQVPGAVLFLVGAGEIEADEQMLKDEALRLGISDIVNFTGFLPKAKMWHYVAKADVCVSPFCPSFALNSTSPTKLIEYMAMGKAVVANDHPEQREVLLQSGGGICVPYEETAFSEAVIELLRDKERAEAMGRKGRLWVEGNRTYGIIADQVESSLLPYHLVKL